MRLGGCPIHSVWMITWTSEMSGNASRGIRLSDQTPASTSVSTPKARRKRFALHQSIVLSIIVYPHIAIELLADTSICLVAIGWPPLDAVIVRLQVPPLGSSIFAA